MVTMAAEPIMMSPICLVENQEEQLNLNPEALQILNKISQPVVVVGIVGLYRTGKSYLMNCLAGQNHGFPLGSTVRSTTKGIWMWCVPHPSKLNHTLVLLDTEGLSNLEKEDPKNDSWIFALTVLLSSTLIYNSMGTINSQALEQLHYMTELTQLVRAKSSSDYTGVEDSAKFVSFFPDFIWALRDFTLEMKINGYSVTEDEYLEDALKLLPGTNPKIQNSNMSRECIRQFFPKRKCFIFDRPTNDKNLLAHIENVPEDQLDSSFREQSNKFRTYVFTHTKTKTLREGIIVTGNRLETLLKAYVVAIKTGEVPCLENVVTALAQRENSVAVQKAADHYSEQMAQRVSFPTDTLQELLDVHTDCEREAIAVFMEHSFKDDKQEFQKNLMDMIEKKKKDFLLQNEYTSVKYSQAKLQQLTEPLMKSISTGTFCVPGGHSLYLEAKNKVEWDYNLVPRKGVKANEVLQHFLQSQVAIEKSILQGDKALTCQEKALAAERAKKEAAEKEQELLTQKHKEQLQKMEAQERGFRENIAQLREKLEKERESLQREQENMLMHKLKVQEELRNEGFEKKSEKLRREIQLLKKEIVANKDKYLLDQWIIDMTDGVFSKETPDHTERAKKQATEKEQELLTQKHKEQLQKMEAQERGFRENIPQMREKLEKEIESLLREQEKVLMHKLKILEASGFQRQKAQIP
ncbi:guanylate-binding protein 4-like isoform X1 [Panthera leo]|uniref:guanylate-binding protein 4-like isoform X1 n=2 Tax=Panthera leo TaxID=9689 RepID=UPI001C69E333|nr:guanylate-binding protein 4-like isoform X1 [Panthera leo]